MAITIMSMNLMIDFVVVITVTYNNNDWENNNQDKTCITIITWPWKTDYTDHELHKR